MDTLLHVGLGNAILASALAVVAAAVAHLARRPALAHSLWLLVLLKLVTPPLVRVPLPWPAAPAVGPEEVALPPTGPPEAAVCPACARVEPEAPEPAPARLPEESAR